MRTLLTMLAITFLVQAIALPDADAKKKRKRKNAPPPAAETAVEEDAAPANGEAEANGAAALNGNGEGESKSISERLDDDGSEGALRSSRRMEFDERLVKGQAAKSGAVYLFKRIPRRLPGLVPLRKSYRRRIVEPVLGAVELKPATYSYEVVKEKKKKKREETLEQIEEAKEAAEQQANGNGKEAKEKKNNRAKADSNSDSEQLIEEID